MCLPELVLSIVFSRRIVEPMSPSVRENVPPCRQDKPRHQSNTSPCCQIHIILGGLLPFRKDAHPPHRKIYLRDITP
jgi:hypothetical protein